MKMNVFYEDDGQFKVGAIFADNIASLQVEAPHGKRAKIKAQSVLLRFESSLHEFLPQAEKVAGAIDLDFLWEASGEDEFGFADLARDYFGRAVMPQEHAGLLIRLHDAPMHFYKKGRGRYRPAPPDALKSALASVEKKRVQAELLAGYVEELGQFKLPAEFAPHLKALLYKPDRNGLENKALEAACEKLHLSPVRLLEKCGAIPSVHDYHLNRFLFEYFPLGTGFDAVEASPLPADLPLADVQAFSIDDATTTEIDDAFSVTPLPDGNWRVGIHIAAPALGIGADSELDRFARGRLSTVYHPAGKITMLPESVIARFTLAAGHACPVLSLYVVVTDDLRILETQSRVERVVIAENLRLDQLEASFTDENIAAGTGDYPRRTELDLLWRLASVLEAARGKADSAGQDRLDYAFRVTGDVVTIAPRKRGSPSDKVVSELMILVNSTWGGLLAEHGIPALYRVQQAGKVRMSTHPAPHDGLGVAQYTWSSSPIRRYVDLVNQRQLLAHLSGNGFPYPAASDLFETMRAFELAYDAYAEFQRGMERYWCLRYLQQEAMTTVSGSVIRDNLVRLESLPLVVRVGDLPALPAATRVQLDLGSVDLLDLELVCHFRQNERAVAAA